MSKLRQLSFSLGLDATPAEIPDLGTYGELVRVFNSIHTLADYFDRLVGPLPVPVDDRAYKTPKQTVALQNISRIYPQAGENILNRSLVRINSSGEAVYAIADAAKDKLARGISLGAVTSGGYVEVVLFGVVDGLSGMTPGATYYLSTISGVITNTPPGGADLVQPIGFALSSTQLFFNPTSHHAP